MTHFFISTDPSDNRAHIEMLYDLYTKIPLFKTHEIIKYFDGGHLVYINHTSDYTWIRICMDDRKMYAIDIENDMWNVELKRGDYTFFYFKGYFKHFLCPINEITYVDTFYSDDLMEFNGVVMRLQVDTLSVLQGFLAHQTTPLFERNLFKILYSYLK